MTLDHDGKVEEKKGKYVVQKNESEVMYVLRGRREYMS